MHDAGPGACTLALRARLKLCLQRSRMSDHLQCFNENKVYYSYIHFSYIMCRKTIFFLASDSGSPNFQNIKTSFCNQNVIFEFLLFFKIMVSFILFSLLEDFISF